MENNWHVDKKGEFTSYWRDEELTSSSSPYISIKCTEIASGKKHLIDADIIVETMYDIHINGSHIDSFLASPDQLKELAVGYLICEGHITTLDNILSLKILDGTIQCEVVEGSEGQCREHDPDVCISSNVIFDLMDHIRKHGVTWRRTGGTHSSIVSDMTGNIVTFCEDVSRASSVDKAVGKAILDGADLSRCVLITTGRLSVTMVTKVANAGFPLVASKAAPLSGGLELAKEKDITLVAFVRRPNMYIYTGEQRIV